MSPRLSALRLPQACGDQISRGCGRKKDRAAVEPPRGSMQENKNDQFEIIITVASLIPESPFGPIVTPEM